MAWRTPCSILSFRLPHQTRRLIYRSAGLRGMTLRMTSTSGILSPMSNCRSMGFCRQPRHMNGFVLNRASDLAASGHQTTPTSPQLKDVMAGFSPTEHTADGQGPFAAARVISTLARNFAVCDNWHASVPGPTFPNRSFLHAGTSNGFVSNAPVDQWAAYHSPTIFNRMAERNLAAQNLSHRHGSAQPSRTGL